MLRSKKRFYSNFFIWVFFVSWRFCLNLEVQVNLMRLLKKLIFVWLIQVCEDDILYLTETKGITVVV